MSQLGSSSPAGALDRAAVRQIVDRLVATDRDYRARVPKDSPVAKCLVE